MLRSRTIFIVAGVAAIALAATVWFLTARCAGRWETAIGRPGFDEPVRAFALFQGDLIAGGMFLEVDGRPASRLARWDGTRWTGVSARLSIGPVRTLHVFDDGAGEALFIAGQFPHVVRWDGRNWSQLGPGFDEWVLTLTSFDDGEATFLYTAGRFRYVARWDGQAWSQIGEDFDGPVLALAEFDGALHAGGAFTGGVARWNGEEWRTVGEGVEGVVNVLAQGRTASGAALFAGGRFSRAGDREARNIAMWDGSTWHALGDGVGGEVQSMTTIAPAEDAPSLLYLGGAFTEAGGVRTSRIARWNGQQFAPLGRGADERVQALLADRDDRDRIAVYTGGIFDRAGGRAARSVAIWRECEE